MGGRGSISTGGVSFLIIFLIAIASCDTQRSVGIQDSLSVIPNLTLIEGAESSSVTVNRSSDSYFSVDVSSIAANNYIKSGEGKAWCIQWDKPIASNNDRHDGLQLYSTLGDNNWKAINYLLNIRPYLQLKDPSLTYKEIQVAIWSLLDFPSFDLNKININQLPSRMSEHGQYAFDRKKVDQIVTHVRQNYESFQYSSSTTFAVVAEMNTETQTIIIEVDESVWAYGQHSFRSQKLREELGITGTGKGQWGWIYELDSDYASTELIAGGGDDDGTMAANEVGTIIGSLEMARSGSTLEVAYTVHSDYLIGDLHLWVGCSLQEFPWVGDTGNVAPGQFPYYYDEAPVSSYTFNVNLSDLDCSGNIFISAHAGELYYVEEIGDPGDVVLEPVLTIKDLRSEYGFIVAWDVNDHGHIVGGSSYWDSDSHTMINMGSIFARSINNNGQVAGSNKIWDINSGAITLGTLEGNLISRFENDPDYAGSWSSTTANDLNENGVVVGEVFHEVSLGPYVYEIDGEDYYLYDEFYEFYEFQAFIWDDNSGMRTVTNPPLYGDEWVSYATGINNNGWVTGVDFNISNRGFIWDEINGVRSLGSFPGFSNYRPVAINNYGQVAGTALVLQDNATVSLVAKKKDAVKSATNDIDKLLRLTNTMGIYDFGHVVEMINGSTFQSDALPWEENLNVMKNNSYQSHLSTNWNQEQQNLILEIAQTTTYRSEPFIWDEINGMQSLGTLGGDWISAWDINDHGQVVGYGSIGGGESRAFFWDPDHGMIELPTLGGNSLARALNNEGQIVGYSYDGNGRFHPVMWEVTFQPAALASN